MGELTGGSDTAGDKVVEDGAVVIGRKTRWIFWRIANLREGRMPRSGAACP